MLLSEDWLMIIEDRTLVQPLSNSPLNYYLTLVKSLNELCLLPKQRCFYYENNRPIPVLP